MTLRKCLIAAFAAFSAAATAIAQPMHNMDGMNHASPVAEKSGSATGVIRLIQADRNSVTIEHSPITGLGWPGMTMPFKLKSPDMLKGLKVGAKVRFDVQMIDHQAVITKINLQ